MNDVYTLRPAITEDFAFMRDAKLDGLRPYVEALWGWNQLEQERQFRTTFDPAQSEIISVGGKPVGWIESVVRDRTLWISGLYLIAAARGRGIGSAVLRGRLRVAARRSMPTSLRVLRGNPAIRLYERLGFGVAGETDHHILMEAPPPTSTCD